MFQIENRSRLSEVTRPLVDAAMGRIKADLVVRNATLVNVNSDEIIMVCKGTGEMNINDKWVTVKAGDLHVCPRGAVHATRATAGEEMWMIGIYTPALPAGGDRVMVEG